MAFVNDVLHTLWSSKRSYVHRRYFVGFRIETIFICLPPALERDFDDRLHAQHLVTGPIIYANGSVSFPVSDAIRSHLADPNPSKALVLYFQGPTGVGKNFVSNIIADNLFDGKRNSKYVHTIMGPHHFPDKSQLGSYKVSRKRIKTNILHRFALSHANWPIMV